MPGRYSACRSEVYNRGRPPIAFLDELIDWAAEAPVEIFEKNDRFDIYSSVVSQLGPYRNLAHRRAVMLEVLRVLGGFESSWKWKEGVDTTNPASNTPCTEEAGIFQCSGDAMQIDPSLKAFAKSAIGSTSCKAFIEATKADHRFAIEFCARLLRFSVTHHGPVKHKKIHPWLRPDAVAEFQSLLPEAETAPIVVPAPEVIPHPTMATPHGRAEIEAMFGNPARADGTLNEAWEGANIRKVPPPDRWQLYYQDDHGLVPVSGIRMHRLLADVFVATLDEIWAYAQRQIGGVPSTGTVRAWLHDRRLDVHGGGFNFRPIRGARALSLHSYGIAIDWDPDHNPRKKPLSRTLPNWWYDIWNVHGWHDGRGFPTPDPMHVQFATGA